MSWLCGGSMDLLNNAWVVGIGGGILSGLFVTLVTRYAFSKKDNREYAQKVEAVNREVIYSLRPGISEDRLPSVEVLEALINATARRYKVSREDIYKPKQIAEELIKEILDSSFISSETKQSYCETLAHLMKPAPTVVDSEGIRVAVKFTESHYRDLMASRMSAILGLTAAIATMATVFTKDVPSLFIDVPSLLLVLGKFDVLLPTLAILVATSVAMTAMLSAKRLREHTRLRERTNSLRERANRLQELNKRVESDSIRSFQVDAQDL